MKRHAKPRPSERRTNARVRSTAMKRHAKPRPSELAYLQTTLGYIPTDAKPVSSRSTPKGDAQAGPRSQHFDRPRGNPRARRLAAVAARAVHAWR